MCNTSSRFNFHTISIHCAAPEVVSANEAKRESSCPLKEMSFRSSMQKLKRLHFVLLLHLSFTSISSPHVKNGKLHQASQCDSHAVTRSGRDRACERKCVLGKWSRVSQRSLPLLKLRFGPGWVLGMFRWGVEVQGECVQDCGGGRDKVDRWEPADPPASAWEEIGS